MDQERKRVAAEDKLALKALGGQITGDDAVVGDVDLGGNTYNVSQPPTAASGFGKLAGGALLAAALAAPTAAVAWKYLDRPVPPPAVDTDSITELRIFRDE